MIYTVTLNPALDRTIWIDRIQEDVTNRILEEHTFAGGKSIDVSRVLKNFGIDSVALGFVGGFKGRELEGRLLNIGIPADFVRVSGETRTNIIIHEKDTGRQIAFSARGPEILASELMQLVEKIETLPCPDIVAIGGSLPPGVNPAIYAKIVSLAKKCQAKVVLDVDGEALSLGIKAKPDIIKPNIHELSALVGQELKEFDDVIAAARGINRQGVAIVLVSMGAKGILLIADQEEYIAIPPDVSVEGTIGAGDSSVAGFICGLVQGKDLKECLIYAVASGTATTLQQGTALCLKKDFLQLVPQVKLHILSASNASVYL